jgi:hypothetical protein
VRKDAGEPPVRFDEREVEADRGMRVLRHSRGNREMDYVEAYTTAPPLDAATAPFFPPLRMPTFNPV